MKVEEAAVDGGPKWGKVIDQTKCIGCHACTVACKSENEVPLGVTRTYVKSVDVGVFPQARRNFQVTRCNQCADAPCVTACPTGAMYQRDDGIVDFDKRICIGCKACIAACPYDAIFINPDDGAAEKCNFCAHRVDMGLEPACVVVCPVEAILVGDMNDPTSKVAKEVNRTPVQVRRPEKDTRPKLWYKGAHQSTLDPIAARRPSGGMYMWSEQPDVDHGVPAGAPDGANSSAAALLSYDVPHRAPWDARVSLYTWTKSISAGAYLMALLLALFGFVEPTGDLWRWAAPIVGAAFLAITVGVLIWDLDHPERFYMVLTKAQKRSWLVRGGYLITGFAAVLGLHLLVSIVGAWSDAWLAAIAVPGIVLAGGTAMYTAFLFAQAKARDLWQNPLLPPHFVVQAGLAGAAALLPFAGWLAPDATDTLGWWLAATAGAHLLLVAGEVTLPHTTAHAHMATREMVFGRFAGPFWAGIVLVGVAVAAPWIGVWATAPALIGLFAQEHAYVQAGQSVPLA